MLRKDAQLVDSLEGRVESRSLVFNVFGPEIANSVAFHRPGGDFCELKTRCPAWDEVCRVTWVGLGVTSSSALPGGQASVRPLQ